MFFQEFDFSLFAAICIFLFSFLLISKLILQCHERWVLAQDTGLKILKIHQSSYIVDSIESHQIVSLEPKLA